MGVFIFESEKAALDHFTRTMATNLMFEGVKVNSVNPATVRTDIHYSKGTVYTAPGPYSIIQPVYTINNEYFQVTVKSRSNSTMTK